MTVELKSDCWMSVPLSRGNSPYLYSRTYRKEQPKCTYAAYRAPMYICCLGQNGPNRGLRRHRAGRMHLADFSHAHVLQSRDRQAPRNESIQMPSQGQCSPTRTKYCGLMRPTQDQLQGIPVLLNEVNNARQASLNLTLTLEYNECHSAAPNYH